jgi:glycosyltransferase involved in cell wall biosynthesis
MKIAILTTDNREPARQYEKEVPWFGTAPEALLQGFAGIPEVEVHVVSCTQKAIFSPDKLAPNIFFHSLHVPKIGWMRTAYAGCIRAVRRKLREISPDIVHGQGTERDCALSAIFSGYPNVVTIHGNMRAIARGNNARPFSFGWLAAKLEAFTLPRTDGVVCITTYTRKSVESLARKTWIIPNAVDPTFFEISKVPISPPRLLCVGNILKLKNQVSLINALDTFKEKWDFEISFLGSSESAAPYTGEFLTLTQARPWCRYEGFVDRKGLKTFLASATGLIHPTREDNCPMVVLEAMAAGVPVAASRIGGIPDLIRHGETGLLFDPLNQAEMARAAEQLLTSPLQAMAETAREVARKRFHPETVARQHLEVYREVLAEAVPHPHP